MTLFGLDILLTPHDEPKICEVNGANTGMMGFEHVYGDDHVERSMRDHFKEVIKECMSPWELYSFREDEIRHRKKFSLIGTAQGKSGGINPQMHQLICENKFYQGILIKELAQDPSIQDLVIPSIPVGTGVTIANELENFLLTAEEFISKPARGLQGIGVHRLSKELVREFYGGKQDFTFQYLLDQEVDKLIDVIIDGYILQPFIPTKKNGSYRSVRAIFCDETFIDAYCRCSSEPIVNLCRGARAERFSADSEFIETTEHFIKTFSARCQAMEESKEAFGELVGMYITERHINNLPEEEYDKLISTLAKNKQGISLSFHT